jgi:hypothetical protein
MNIHESDLDQTSPPGRQKVTVNNSVNHDFRAFNGKSLFDSIFIPIVPSLYQCSPEDRSPNTLCLSPDRVVIYGPMYLECPRKSDRTPSVAGGAVLPEQFVPPTIGGFQTEMRGNGSIIQGDSG